MLLHPFLRFVDTKEFCKSALFVNRKVHNFDFPMFGKQTKVDDCRELLASC